VTRAPYDNEPLTKREQMTPAWFETPEAARAFGDSEVGKL
jgi:hypothetical protein